MELRPGYKRTEIGVIPEEWHCRPLEDFTSLISYGFTNPMPTSLSGPFMITAADISGGRIILENARRTSVEAFDKLLTAKSKPRKNDLLLTKDGALGRVALVGAEAICINQSVAVIRPNSLINPRFFSFLLQADHYQHRMLEDAGGTTIKHIYITIVNKMPIGVPLELGEQKAIAEVLSDVDASIAAQTRLIAKKRDLRQGAMQRLLTGQTRLPGFGSRITRTRDTEIGPIPADWDLIPLGEAFEIQLGKMLDAEKNTGIPKPYLGNRAVQWGHIDVTNLPTMRMSPTDMSKFRLRKGDLLVCEGGEVGRCALYMGDPIECYYQKALHRLRSRGAVDPQLVVALFRRYSETGLFSNYVTQTSIAHLPKDKISLIPVLNLSDKEQKAILSTFRDMDVEIATLDARLGKTRALKQAMMQALLTGRVRLPVRSDVTPPTKEAAHD